MDDLLMVAKLRRENDLLKQERIRVEVLAEENRSLRADNRALCQRCCSLICLVAQLRMQLHEKGGLGEEVRRGD